MKNRQFLFASLLIAVLVTVVITSCNKTFDSPPAPYSQDTTSVTVNTTIAQLVALHTVSGAVDTIKTDRVIAGVVVCDDQSGNFYKQIAIEDSTGGLIIRLNAASLYTSYPVGRKIFIKTKGLFLGDYGGVPQLGLGYDTTKSPAVMASIPPAFFDTYIIKGSVGNVVTPKKVTIAQLTGNSGMQSPYVSTLIAIDNCEFGDTTKTYADPTKTVTAVNLNINSCDGSTVVARTSSYASFAGLLPKTGNGTIVAIAGAYKGTPQLTIRDTSDIYFYGTRCGGSVTPPPPPPPGGFINLSTLNSLYQGTGVLLGSSTKITGIVISDASSANMSAGNMILQNGNAGIDIYFGSSAATTNFNIGDSIVIDISGDSLIKYNGLLEIKAASSQLPTSAIATGINIVPKVLTTAQFVAGMNANPSIACTLVTINNATATSADGTYYGTSKKGNSTLTDASGTTTLYTSKNATFAATALPTGAKSFTGYGTFYKTTPQFSIRNTNDVK